MTKTYIDELAEEIAKLREENNKLNEMCNYWSIEETERTMECYKLKSYLRECREYIGNNFVSPKMRITLTEIDKVLK